MRMNELESRILRFIDESPTKVTFGRIKSGLSESTTIRPDVLKRSLANLVSSGVLCYTSHYGRSFIERSLDKPLQVSRHVILKPSRCSVDTMENCVVVSLQRGASFGGGEHPTTRMAIRMLDDCLHQPDWRQRKNRLKAIDIGTGSGILSIVAAKLGLGFTIGVDTDPCSRYEARENVTINRLSNQIRIGGESILQLHETFDLVFANLRTPTLIGLRHDLQGKLNEKCVLIFSGMKVEESPSVCETYENLGFSVVVAQQEKGWGAICLRRG